MAHDRILIVDDDPDARDETAAVLAKRNHTPVIAYDVHDAIARLERDDSINLVLTEIVLTGLDGARMIQRMLTIAHGTPVIVVTSLRDINAAIVAMRSGVFDYLLKPVEPGTLVDGVERALDHRHHTAQHSLDKENLERLVAARTDLLHAAIADLEQAYDITLEALGDALDLKDAETEGHSRRVTAYTIALARAMGLKGDAIRIVSRGAFLHDIGKMAIPDAILLKPGKLDRHEQAMMRDHCARGYQILRKIPFLQDAAQIVYSHQERYDGTGYPRRLKGEEIVLGARIFAVADTLDAITSDRPYRRASSFEVARAEILRCSGTQFDPAVIKVFESLPTRLWEDLQAEITHHARISSLTSK
ncbi:MAG TPA: HD domain-containing phosphohydrolase [Acidobacteriaceae bacterium]|nr:HD domain-containing phosphohydrolase [Acidobacteriaceae bacterium]